MKAELHYQQNSLILEDVRYNRMAKKDCEYDNDTHVFVRAVSGFFAGTATFECNLEDLKQLAEDLVSMYAFQKERAVLMDSDYGSEIEFRMQKTGRFAVGGDLYGDYCGNNTLCFEFEADQTVLLPFVRELEALIENAMRPKEKHVSSPDV